MKSLIEQQQTQLMMIVADVVQFHVCSAHGGTKHSIGAHHPTTPGHAQQNIMKS